MHHPDPDLHRRVVMRLGGTRIPREPEIVSGAAQVRFMGPGADRASRMLGGAAVVNATMANLVRAVHKTGPPSPGCPGVIDLALARALLFSYAQELSADGMGVLLELPVMFGPDHRFSPPGHVVGLGYSLWNEDSPVARVDLVGAGGPGG